MNLKFDWLPKCALVCLLVYCQKSSKQTVIVFSFHEKAQILHMVSHRIGHFRAVKKCKTPFVKIARKNCRYKQTLLLTRSRLFKHWIALSTGLITIQWISTRAETNCVIQQIEIYPMDSVIHLSNGIAAALKRTHQWFLILTPNNTKTIETMTCHCFRRPTRRGLTSSSYTTLRTTEASSKYKRRGY